MYSFRLLFFLLFRHFILNDLFYNIIIHYFICIVYHSCISGEAGSSRDSIVFSEHVSVSPGSVSVSNQRPGGRRFCGGTRWCQTGSEWCWTNTEQTPLCCQRVTHRLSSEEKLLYETNCDEHLNLFSTSMKSCVQLLSCAEILYSPGGLKRLTRAAAQWASVSKAPCLSVCQTLLSDVSDCGALMIVITGWVTRDARHLTNAGDELTGRFISCAL